MAKSSPTGRARSPMMVWHHLRPDVPGLALSRAWAGTKAIAATDEAIGMLDNTRTDGLEHLFRWRAPSLHGRRPPSRSCCRVTGRHRRGPRQTPSFCDPSCASAPPRQRDSLSHGGRCRGQLTAANCSRPHSGRTGTGLRRRAMNDLALVAVLPLRPVAPVTTTRRKTPLCSSRPTRTTCSSPRPTGPTAAVSGFRTGGSPARRAHVRRRPEPGDHATGDRGPQGHRAPARSSERRQYSSDAARSPRGSQPTTATSWPATARNLKNLSGESSQSVTSGSSVRLAIARPADAAHSVPLTADLPDRRS
jgi:hypothetical protein